MKILVGYGIVPSLITKDLEFMLTEDGHVSIPKSSSETIFVSILDRISGFPHFLSLMAERVPLGIEDISPLSGGSGGFVTLEITGSGFDETLDVYLTSGTSQIGAFRVFRRNSTSWRVTFDLVGANLGVYDLVLDNGVISAVMPGRFEIVPRTRPDDPLVTSVYGPGSMSTRSRVDAELIVNVKNISNNDIEAVLVTLTAPEIQGMSIIPLGLPSGELDQDCQQAASLNHAYTLDGLSTCMVLLSPGLAPGESEDVVFRVTGIIPGDTQFVSLSSPVQQEQIIPSFDSSVDALIDRYRANPSDLPEIPEELILELEDPDSREYARQQLLDRYPEVVAYYDRGIDSEVPVSESQRTRATVSLVGLFSSGIGFILNLSQALHPFPDGSVALAGHTFATGTLGAISLGCAVVKVTLCFNDVQCDSEDLESSAWTALALIVASCLFFGALLTGNIATVGCILALASGFTYSIGMLLIHVDRIQSFDPNEKLGPGGDGYVSLADRVDYTILFENLETATAPAMRVSIVDTLSAEFDPRTFRVGRIAFGDTVLFPPANSSYWHAEVEDEEYGQVVIDAGVNTVTGVARWDFQTIDPGTGLPPNDPSGGFLPPNIVAGSGEGAVDFSVRAWDEVQPGMELTNIASITFDDNPPIITNEVVNTVRTSLPDLFLETAGLATGAASVLEGEPVDVVLGLRNIGDLSSGAFSLEFSGTSDAGGELAGQLVEVPGGLDPDRDLQIETQLTTDGITGLVSCQARAVLPDSLPEITLDNNSRVLTFGVLARRFEVELTSGINFVGLPLEVSALGSARDFMQFLGSGYLIRMNSLGQFEAFIPEVHSGDGWSLSGGVGYFVYLQSPISARFEGVSWEDSLRFVSGTNLLSAPRRSVSVRYAADLAAMTGAGLVSRYEPSRGTFDSFIPGFHDGPGFEILGGEGYLVLARADSTISFSGEGWNEASGETTPKFDNPGLQDPLAGRPVFVVAGDYPHSEKVTVQASVVRTGLSARLTLAPETNEFGLALVDLASAGGFLKGDVLEFEILEGSSGEVVFSWSRSITEGDFQRGYLVVGEPTDSPERSLPRVHGLSLAYPNPFNPMTTFEFQIAKQTRVQIKVYNVRGQCVRTLVDEVKKPGYFKVPWDGTDDSMRPQASGAYFCRMVAGEYTQTRKILMIK